MSNASSSIKVTTYNIHKGFSQFKRHMVVHDLRNGLRALDSDIVFLQEVQGLHLGHGQRHGNWPSAAQHEFLAEGVWGNTAYGLNAVYDHGHHGNAILSRFPIVDSLNQDVTHMRFERRGLLHCTIRTPTRTLHCVCVHLSLFGRSRRQQMGALAHHIESRVPKGAPLIIAGDFNDWRNRAQDELASRLGLVEVFEQSTGRLTRSFPARFPVLRMDRIYVRGMTVADCEIHAGPPWSAISDHAALSAHLVIP